MRKGALAYERSSFKLDQRVQFDYTTNSDRLLRGLVKRGGGYKKALKVQAKD